MFIKKLIVCLLTVSLVLPSYTVADGILTFLNLAKHFNHHNEAHGKIGVIDFLAEHFTETDHTDPHPEHQDSPFSHQHNCTNHLMTIAVHFINKIEFLPHHSLVSIEKTKPIFYSSFYFSPFEPTIWQPPKI